MCAVAKILTSLNAGNKTLVLAKILLGFKDKKYSERGIQAYTKGQSYERMSEDTDCPLNVKPDLVALYDSLVGSWIVRTFIYFSLSEGVLIQSNFIAGCNM